MAHGKRRWLGIGLLGSSGAGLMALTSVVHAAFAFADCTDPAGCTALIMGPTGVPIPSEEFQEAAQLLYMAPNGYGAPGYSLEPVFYPAELYSINGIKNLPLNQSVAEGVTLLNDHITQLTGPNSEGQDVAVFGWSQSATASSLEMDNLAALPADERPSPDQLAFVLLGDPNNPNGGLLERFDGLTSPSLGITFSGATPSDLYPTNIYTLEYDGFADYPQYTLNLLADINAAMGVDYVHPYYLNETPSEIANAIQLATDGPTETTYHIIPTTTLPLLDPLIQLGVPSPIIDLVEPDLKVLVNLGYGSITEGWSQGPANIPTEFGLFPDVSSLAVLEALAQATVTGVQDSISAIGPWLSSLTPTSVLESLFNPLIALSEFTGINAVTPVIDAGQRLTELPSTISSFIHSVITSPNPFDTILESLQTANTDVVNALTSVAEANYAVLLPTADLVNAALTTIPSYDVNLFLDGIEQVANGNLGGLVNALGDPIAADFGLGAMVGIVEALNLADVPATTIVDLAGLIP
jgi:hypothetical protein